MKRRTNPVEVQNGGPTPGPTTLAGAGAVPAGVVAVTPPGAPIIVHVHVHQGIKNPLELHFHCGQPENGQPPKKTRKKPVKQAAGSEPVHQNAGRKNGRHYKLDMRRISLIKHRRRLSTTSIMKSAGGWGHNIIDGMKGRPVSFKTVTKIAAALGCGIDEITLRQVSGANKTTE